jgi:hypothetical protein
MMICFATLLFSFDLANGMKPCSHWRSWESMDPNRRQCEWRGKRAGGGKGGRFADGTDADVNCVDDYRMQALGLGAISRPLDGKSGAAGVLLRVTIA